jgi:hypothetical protein
MMFTKLFGIEAAPKPPAPKEGELYKVIELYGATFEIRYGYYEEIDRQNDPIEIYPDFIKTPVYTENGFPFVTHMQPPCSYYEKKGSDLDNDCSTCAYIEPGEELIGVCRCKENRRASAKEELDESKK